MSRKNDFLHELYEDRTTVAEAELHAQKLRREISLLSQDLTMLPNLRLHYALDELEATESYIRQLRKNIDNEERWAQ